jgi:hypothetical protein
MEELPKQTALIFDYLSKGRFITSNSNEQGQRELYSVIEENPELVNFFDQIGFRLESGDGYFYFSREEEKTGIERKIGAAFKWIDILDFFIAFNNGFAPGFRFYTTQLVEQVRVNGLLRNKLKDLRTKGSERSSREQIDDILKKMEREGFIEKIDDFDDAWKVTAALHYLEQLIMSLETSEEQEDEQQ